MPSVQADQGPRTGRPLLWVAGLVLLALVVAAVFVLRDDDEVLTPSPEPSQGPSTSASPSRADGAATLLGDLADSLLRGSRAEVLALAAPGEPSAQQALATLLDNVRDLGIGALSFRFVDEDLKAVTPQQRRELGSDAWAADVAMTWRVRGFDEELSMMEVGLTLVDTPDGVLFGAVGGDAAEPAPLWLLGDVSVRRGPRSLVMVAGEADPGRYHALAARAVSDVRAVLPRWRGRLVVEIPASQEQLHRALGAEPGTYDAIAAVTAPVDGSRRVGSPSHILINPVVFGRLGAKGSQIVMSHEAAHVATDAATSTMPLWLLEGFADYVALARADLPTEVTASQILAQVRRNGPPRALPGPAEFDPADKRLGTSYEAAWLAARLLAEKYGERRLIAFYDAVDAGMPVEEAFSTVLGTSQRSFTAQWRGYLRDLAA